MTARRRLFAAALIGLFGIWATSALGFWQLRRAAAKEELQQRIETAALAPPAVPDAGALRNPSSLVHRHLALRGRWLTDDVVYLDNRPQAGQAGLYVLMPLRLDAPDGVDVIVNRGWIPRNGADRTRIAPYRTPGGTVEVTGVALPEEPRLLELSNAERSLAGIWQNFDFDAYAKVSGRAPLPLVMRQDRESGGTRTVPATTDDGLSREWPDRGGVLQSQIDRHHGYAFQWFALAATLAALLLFKSLERSGMAEQSLSKSSIGPVGNADARHRSRLKLYLVIAICAAPVLASYYAYYFVRPDARSNYGELIDPQRPTPPLHLTTLEGRPVDVASLRGKWLMLMVAGGACDASCTDRLYHMRQVRLTTGKDRDRVERVWLVTDAVPVQPRRAEEYEGTRMLRVDPAEIAAWLTTDASDRHAERLYMVDPLGNLMMRFPVDADPNKTKRDLAKLLRASRIG